MNHWSYVSHTSHVRGRFGGGMLGTLVAGAAALAILTVPFDGAHAQTTASPETFAPVITGQKYFMATHSFNVFVGPNRRTEEPGPLDLLAREAGLEGHQNLGIQMIGGSTPMQHWNQGDGGDGQNLAKVALRKGGVDVFTMSPNAVIPEQGIDLFGDLMIDTNPEGRILVQVSWAAWDGRGTTGSVGGDGAPSFSNADRDDADLASIQKWIDRLHADDGYLERLRTQLRGINERAERTMAYVVPASDAVYRLRQEVVKGNVPGVDLQSELFRDPIGHPTTPVVNLVTYAWFAVMYRRSPVGMTALVDLEDPTSAEREALLQRLAWNAVVSEPMSGVVGEPVARAVAPSRQLVPGDRGGADDSVEGSIVVEADIPDDIHRDSWARLPLPIREELDGEGQRAYDAVVHPESRYSDGLRGPVAMWVYSPEMARHVFPASTYLRFGTEKDQRLTELAILATAREVRSQYEWTAHEPLAVQAGLEPEIIELVKRRAPLDGAAASVPGLGGRERTIIRFAREVVSEEKLSSETFARAREHFGERGVMDLAGLVGYYNFVNITLKTFDVQLAPGRERLLPDLW